jgi:hypothetical protein
MPARYSAYQAAGSVSERIGEKEKQYLPGADSSKRIDCSQFPKAGVPALSSPVAGVRERSVSVNPANCDSIEDRRALSPGEPGC